VSALPPPDKEDASALHEVVQAGRTDLIHYLLEKGANPELVDANRKKPIDLIGAGESRWASTQRRRDRVAISGSSATSTSVSYGHSVNQRLNP
jgi:Ankyrin repeat